MRNKVGPRKHVAPDGGWGWVIVAAYAINNVMCIPIYQGFALLFRDVFQQLDMSGADISTIINVNSAFGMMLGLWNGPLIKNFGFRKVALIGSMFSFVGFFLTSFASNFIQFIIFYGLINSSGFMVTMTSYSIAMNTYFDKKRARASGLCSTATGLGPVFMPLVISALMGYYGPRGTSLILAALSLHSFVGAMLLQPVQRHYKYLPPISNDEEKPMSLDEEEELEREDEEESDEGELEGMEPKSAQEVESSLFPRRVSDVGLARRGCVVSMHSLNNRTFEPEPKWWTTSTASLYKNKGSTRKSQLVLNEDKEVEPEKRWYHKIVIMFDLDLLKDPIYRNIWFGLSLAFSAEINFSLMTPIILGDRGFDIKGTAQLMSTIAVADLVFRFLSPFIGDRLKIAPRWMYMNALVALIVCRFALTMVTSYYATVIVCLCLGVCKGFRTVYMTLVIPNYVPLDKLPSSTGLQTVLNGIFLLVGGPLLGLLRDKSGSYNICIHVINLCASITVILWTVEYILTKKKERRSEGTI